MKLRVSRIERSELVEGGILEVFFSGGVTPGYTARKARLLELLSWESSACLSLETMRTLAQKLPHKEHVWGVRKTEQGWGADGK